MATHIQTDNSKYKPKTKTGYFERNFFGYFDQLNYRYHAILMNNGVLLI